MESSKELVGFRKMKIMFTRHLMGTEKREIERKVVKLEARLMELQKLGGLEKDAQREWERAGIGIGLTLSQRNTRGCVD